MKRNKRKALTVLKKWVKELNKRNVDEIKVSDFVADWALAEDSDYLRLHGEHENGWYLCSTYSESSFYDSGINSDFVDMLEAKGLFAEHINSSEIGIYSSEV